MDVDRVLAALDTFTTGDLAKVRAKLDELQGRIEVWQQSEDRPAGGGYRQEFVKCGKASCKTCRDGQGHGPYWYRYSSEGGKLKKHYLGKNKPADA